MFLRTLYLLLQISVENYPRARATIPQKRVSLSQPNSYPQPMQQKEL